MNRLSCAARGCGEASNGMFRGIQRTVSFLSFVIGFCFGAILRSRRDYVPRRWNSVPSSHSLLLEEGVSLAPRGEHRNYTPATHGAPATP